jgi:hypothetical protein
MSSREQGKPPDTAPDKAIDGLLRRSLARTPRSQDCPAPDILAAYYDRSLDAEETARYELHFSSCAHCRAQLAAMVRAGELDAGSKQAGGWGWLANRWWFVPAVATAALGLVLSVRLVRKIYEPVPAQQLAINTPPSVAAPNSGLARDSATSADAQLLDRSTEKTEPPAAPAASSEKKSKDLRLVAPRTDTAAKSSAPPPVTKTQITEAAPLVSDSLTAREEFDASRAPAPSGAPRRMAPAPSKPSGAAGGFVAQDQERQQNLRQDQQQLQQQNEITTQVASQAPGQRDTNQQAQAISAPGAVVGGVAQAPQSNSKQLAETAPARADSGELVLKGDNGAMRKAKTSTILKIYSSPDTDAWWRLPGGGFVEFSPDAGENWHRQLLDRNARFLVAAATGGRVCWIAGRDGVIYLTTNGTRWKKITSPANADFVAISARDARSASFTASDRRVFTTEDGGKTWRTTTP